MRTPEGKLKDAVQTELARRGFWRAGGPEPAVVNGWYYMPASNGYGVVGIPDFVGHRRGIFFSIETKAPGKTPTPNQARRHVEIRAGEGLVLVTDDMDDVLEFLDYIEDLTVENDEKSIERKESESFESDDD